MLKLLLALTCLFATSVVAFAQDDQPPPARPIPGAYTITETTKASPLFSIAGEMTITGTGRFTACRSNQPAAPPRGLRSASSPRAI